MAAPLKALTSDNGDPHRRIATASKPDALAVSVCDLVKTYRDGTEANRGISLSVRPGEICAILGPNGAGKTTFLRQLTTELRPTSGSINVMGVDVIADPSRAKKLMGITPQEAGLFDRLTVREHFEYFARFKGLSKNTAHSASTEIMLKLGLIAEGKKLVRSLSGGQRRRILIGLALLGRPPLLILDEPTTGLDPATRRRVWQVIRNAVADGATAILSTHYMEEAERLSDRIGIISEGELIAHGSLDELLARVDRSYRLSYRDRSGEDCVRFCESFAAAQRCVERELLSEYSIARASLEDVYFRLTGSPYRDETAEAL
jgi:ABC-2 type transport system ATP-binding protein